MKETLEVVDLIFDIANARSFMDVLGVIGKGKTAMYGFDKIGAEIEANPDACNAIVEHFGERLGNDNMYVAKIGCKAYDFLRNYREMATLRSALNLYRKDIIRLDSPKITFVPDLKETFEVLLFASELPTKNNIFGVLSLFSDARKAIAGFSKVPAELELAGDTYNAKLIVYFVEKFGDDTVLSKDIAQKADNMLQCFLELRTFIAFYWEASKNNLVAIPTPKSEEVQAIIAPAPRKLKVATKKKTQDDFVESNLL
jgi:hypothetical protein